MKTHLFNGNWLIAVDDFGRVQAAEITDRYRAGLKPAIGDWEVIGEIPVLDRPTAPSEPEADPDAAIIKVLSQTLCGTARHARDTKFQSYIPSMFEQDARILIKAIRGGK
jgi:hypothetical protein